MNIEKMTPNRPAPVDPPSDLLSVGRGNDYSQTAEKLAEGRSVLVEDQFPVGLAVLSELKNILFKEDKTEGFHAYREQRAQYYAASNNLLVSVRNNRIDLKKSPDIGWLKELYPDIADFILPYPKIQGLNSSWQWYVNGIEYPGVKHKIHPYYGAYFPTRSDHLYLFHYWLRKYSGIRSAALDVGTGCGVLAFQLLNRGFETVCATDINPNSLISTMKSAKEFGVEDRMNIFYSDLFENVERKVDLIVFNPPWLPAKMDITGLDRAIYFEEGLFERFFAEALDYLNDEGKIVFIFSNLGQTEGVLRTHPVEEELEKGGRYKTIHRINRKADKPSRKTKRRDHRKGEYIELWELEKR